MSNDAHTAFSSLPTSARGLLCKDNYQPLTIRGCAIRVDVKGYSARVHASYEYINETHHNQSVIAAYSLPYGWHVQSCEVAYNDDVVQTHYTKNATVTSVATASAVALLGGSASSADRSTAWCDVVSQSIPWTVTVGDAVKLSIDYAVMLPATEMVSSFEMTLPLHLLVPPVTQPPKATREYNDLYATTVTRAKYLPTAELSVEVHADLCLPMRGEVKVAQLELDGVTQTSLEHVHVNHIADTVFTLETKGHINAFRRLPLIFGCGLQDTEEPLRLFIETDVGAEGAVRAEDTHAIAIGFTPRLFDLAPNTELVLLVDVHGREQSAVVARAVATGLAALPPSVRLNAVVLHAARSVATSGATPVYGTALFPEGSRAVAEVDLSVLSTAMQALADGAPQTAPEKGSSSHLAEVLRALLSGTPGPLAAGATPKGYARNVIVLTDAGESETKAPTMIQEVVSARDRARVHVVALLPPGAGAVSVDVAQLTILAKHSAGLCVCATIADPTDVTRALVRVAHASAVPTLTHIRMHLDGRAAFDSESGLPLMPHNKTRFFYGLAAADVAQVSVTVTAHVGDHVVEYNATADVAAQPETQRSQQASAGDASTMGLLHTSAAAARIEYLVEAHPHDAALSSAESKEIMALSMNFAIPSPYTQLVQTRQGAAGTALEGQRTVVASRYLPRYCLYPAELQAARRALMASRATASPALTAAPIHASTAPTAPRSNGTTTTLAYMRHVVGDIVNNATPSGAQTEALLRLQTPAEGSYALTAQLAACAGLSLSALEEAQPPSCPSSTAWATSVALEAMQQARDRLTLLAEARAETFLAAQCSEDNIKQWQQWVVAARSLMDQ